MAMLRWRVWMALTLLATGGPAMGREPLAHTYSIVARDASTGRIGVAVQSHWFSVGSVVPWAKPGVGAVATQSLAEVSYGPRGLALMEQGLSPEQALDSLLANDGGRDVRQVAMIDATGRVAVHTGDKCIRFAGHVTGEQYSVQANLMVNDEVVPAMKRAYESATGDLADRMLAALQAGQRAGGDIRGRQSAAMVIVSGERQHEPWDGRILGLRVEDHATPVAELRRLVDLHRAYGHSNRGDELVAAGRVADALSEYTKAAELAPGVVELKFWQAAALYTAGEQERALALFAEVFAAEPVWLEVVPRVTHLGVLPDDADAIQRILEQGPEGER